MRGGEGEGQLGVCIIVLCRLSATGGSASHRSAPFRSPRARDLTSLSVNDCELKLCVASLQCSAVQCSALISFCDGSGPGRVQIRVHVPQSACAVLVYCLYALLGMLISSWCQTLGVSPAARPSCQVEGYLLWMG